MPVEDPAVRAKTIVAMASWVEVGVPGRMAPLGRHAVERSGAVSFSLSEAAPDCAHLLRPGVEGPRVELVAHDVSSVPHHDRIRGRVRLSGPVVVLPEVPVELRRHLGLHPEDLVGRLMPDQISLEWHVEDAGGPTELTIDPVAWGLADLDALGGWQDEWIAHLDAHHRVDLHHLAARVLGQDPVGDIRPVLADEGGIVLREHSGGCHRDLRVLFGRPVTCGCEAVRALSELVADRLV